MGLLECHRAIPHKKANNELLPSKLRSPFPLHQESDICVSQYNASLFPFIQVKRIVRHSQGVSVAVSSVVMVLMTVVVLLWERVNL